MTTNAKRVFLVSEYYPPNQIGGAELSVERLAQTLAASGVMVTVITINFEEFRVSRNKKECVAVIFIPFLFHLCSRKWQNLLLRSWFFYLFLGLVILWFSLRQKP